MVWVGLPMKPHLIHLALLLQDGGAIRVTSNSQVTVTDGSSLHHNIAASGDGLAVCNQNKGFILRNIDENTTIHIWPFPLHSPSLFAHAGCVSPFFHLIYLFSSLVVEWWRDVCKHRKQGHHHGQLTPVRQHSSLCA